MVMICRVMTINGRRTSVSLEKGFWEALDDVAKRRTMSVAQLASEVDEARGNSPLPGALRVAAVSYFREALNRPMGMSGLRQDGYDNGGHHQNNERT
jgi:predicted DNA-binding ribbon-helix-helix protein